MSAGGTASSAGAPLIVLDRDGVINEDSDDYVKSVAEWRPIPGSLEALAALHRAGYSVVVVTNQSGVGRGLYSERTLGRIHEHMRRTVEAAGGALAGIYYCPHRPDEGCACRKPATGLFDAVARHFGRSLAGVPFVGDKASDLEAARAVGARPVLVRTGYGVETERGLAAPVEVYDDLAAAVAAILGERAGAPR